jgi:uncharacterized protein YndB with AHSA1/START domain
MRYTGITQNHYNKYMDQKYTAKVTKFINASPAKVWEALTTPAMIKQYLFETNVESNWEVGSSITYTGQWDGKEYQDKGVIKEFQPEKLLATTYWSSFSDKEDKPENYQNVTYRLEAKDGGTEITIEQDGSDSEESAKQSEENWGKVLDGMKKLVEG